MVMGMYYYTYLRHSPLLPEMEFAKAKCKNINNKLLILSARYIRFDGDEIKKLVSVYKKYRLVLLNYII